MDAYTQVLEFFMENNIQLTSEQLIDLKEYFNPSMHAMNHAHMHNMAVNQHQFQHQQMLNQQMLNQQMINNAMMQHRQIMKNHQDDKKKLSKLAEKEADKVVNILKKYLKAMDKNPKYKKKFKELKSNGLIHEDKSLSEIKIYPGKNNTSYYTIFADIEWMDQDVFSELCDFLVDVEKSVKNDKEFKKLSTVNYIILISDSPAFEIACKIA